MSANIFLVISGFVMSVLVGLCCSRIVRNFKYLEELESGFPEEIKDFLDTTTSSVQRYTFRQHKSEPINENFILVIDKIIIAGVSYMIVTLIFKLIGL